MQLYGRSNLNVFPVMHSKLHIRWYGTLLFFRHETAMLHSSRESTAHALEFGVTEIQDGLISQDYIARAGEGMLHNINNRQTS